MREACTDLIVTSDGDLPGPIRAIDQNAQEHYSSKACFHILFLEAACSFDAPESTKLSKSMWN
jgi:hypothetical protein